MAKQLTKDNVRELFMDVINVDLYPETEQEARENLAYIDGARAMAENVMRKITELGGAAEMGQESETVAVVHCRDCKYSYEDISGRYCSHGPCKDWAVLDDSSCGQGDRRTGNGKAVDEG